VQVRNSLGGNEIVRNPLDGNEIIVDIKTSNMQACIDTLLHDSKNQKAYW
jgi:hypothetical protein